jgi:aldose 1-epimerase
MAVECIELKDSVAGSSARILAGLGFNCFEFNVAAPSGPVNVLWSEKGFDRGLLRPSGSGIPLLFPFPGRIPGEVLRWEGREYKLQAGDGRGNAIHGFVLDRPWRVVAATANRVVGQFHAAREDAALRECWPADFCLTVSYELIGNSLRSELTVENPDKRPLPFGLGTHPYFRLPLGGPSADRCIVKVPVSERWELADLLPTGRRLPVDDPEAHRTGMEFGEMKFDDIFCGLVYEKDRCATTIEDPGSKLRLVQEFDHGFRECVVYTPPHREAVCIEPYTCLSGAHDLQAKGLDAGIRSLAPGDSFSATVEIRVEGM